MSCLYISIAGFNIKIVFKKTDWRFAENKIKNEIKKHLKGFITKKSKKIDFTINFVEKRYFISKKNKSGHQFVVIFEKKSTSQIDTYYQIGLLQFLFLLREIINELLAQNQGYILHASATSYDSSGYIFLGRPTAGKSTIIKLFSKEYKPLADDSVYLRKIGDRFFLFQTPMIEKEMIKDKNRKKYLIEKIFFLKKGDRFFLEEINNKKKILQMIIGQLLTNKNLLKKQLPQIMKFIDENRIFYNLTFSRKSKVRLVHAGSSRGTSTK